MNFQEEKQVEIILPQLHRKQSLIVKSRRSKYGVFACGTKFGKTLGFSIKAAYLLINSRRPKQFLWAAPYYSNAKVGYKYIKNLLPSSMYIENKSTLTLTMLHNYSTIVFRSINTNPEAIEGELYHHVFIDEASKMKPEGISSIRTTTTQTKAFVDIFSTPRGRGWFYSYYMKGLDKDEPDYTAYSFRTIDNPYIDPAEIQIARRELPDRLFRQYYLAEFVENGEVFTGFRDCTFGKRIDLTGSTQYWLDGDVKDRHVVIGADWAKKQDYTVFIAIDVKSDKPRVIGYRRFQGASYIDAVKELKAFGEEFAKVLTVYHDETGVGSALSDIAYYLKYPMEGVLFTNESKSEMVKRLILRVERKGIEMPNITEILKEFEVYGVEVTKTGKMSYAAAEGQHDDIISALMLAVSAHDEHKGGLELRYMDDLKISPSEKDQFYSQLLGI